MSKFISGKYLPERFSRQGGNNHNNNQVEKTSAEIREGLLQPVKLFHI
jgi:hypothetical protein